MVLNMAALTFLILILQALTGKHIIFIPMLWEIQVDPWSSQIGCSQGIPYSPEQEPCSLEHMSIIAVVQLRLVHVRTCLRPIRKKSHQVQKHSN